MTAHVLQEKRQECRDAGMDDFLSKPVSMAAIQGAIERWSVSDDFDKAIGPQSLQKLKALGEDVFRNILSTALRDIPIALEQIEVAAEEKDWGTLRRHAHFLKGTVVTLDAIPLMELCLDLETVLAEGDERAIKALMTEISDLGRILSRSLERAAAELGMV